MGQFMEHREGGDIEYRSRCKTCFAMALCVPRLVGDERGGIGGSAITKDCIEKTREMMREAAPNGVGLVR